MKIPALLFAPLLVVSLILFAKPSSEIPPRREFPLNTKLNPCVDFHKYVCSNVEASFKLRPDRSKHTFAFSDSDERILEAKKKYLADIHKNENLTTRSKQVRDFYLACMNEKKGAPSEKAEVTSRVQELTSVKTPADLMTLQNQNLPDSLGNFFSVFPSANSDNPKKLDLFIGGNFLGLPDHKYYDDPKLMKDYEKLLALFVKTVHKNISQAQANQKAKAMIKMQLEFRKVYPEASVRRQRWSEKRSMSQTDFLKKYPKLKAEIIFAQIPKDTSLRVNIPETFDFLNENLEKLPLDMWKDVYLAKQLSSLMDDGYPTYFKAAFEFKRKYFGGSEKRSSRDERCTDLVDNHFVKEIDAELVQKLFPNFDDAKFDALASKVRQSLIKGLEMNTWLSKEAKKEALKKIKVARLQLVRPRNDREWNFNLERVYSDQDKIANKRKFSAAAWEKAMKELTEPANQDAWGMGPLTVNAYYNPPENKFVMPMGILQFPFYDQTSFEIENLASVGAVIGHELGHGVDDNGSRYDAEGKLTNWMPMKDLAIFSERTKKMIDQFDKAGFDGKLTLGENVADLVGVTFAYQAAFPEGKGSKEDKQKFFVAYARTWCTVVRPDYAKLLLKTDSHAAGYARINEQVKQQPAFAEAFSCKAGDPMVLPDQDRVQIW